MSGWGILEMGVVVKVLWMMMGWVMGWRDLFRMRGREVEVGEERNGAVRRRNIYITLLRMSE